jgi:Flp pilus assembly protein TadG
MRSDLSLWYRRVAADSAGSVMIEFAIGLPVLLLLVVGMLDLGRFGLQKSAMLQGARAGAQYGMAAANDTANINLTAQTATGLTGVTATSTKFCECVSGTAVGCGTTCSGGGAPKTYITVNTTKAFASVLSVATLNFGAVSWTPPTSVSASVTMIVP